MLGRKKKETKQLVQFDEVATRRGSGEERKVKLTAAYETAHCWKDPSTENPEFLASAQED